ncbi:MAG TPA: hypothetical protein ENJ53_04470 [Phaeodactylibacter sp.]|nr:hypothetical protein [Phaeodactylibacter sp.]
MVYIFAKIVKVLFFLKNTYLRSAWTDGERQTTDGGRQTILNELVFIQVLFESKRLARLESSAVRRLPSAVRRPSSAAVRSSAVLINKFKIGT